MRALRRSSTPPPVPLAPHLGIFVTSLIAQQYAASVIYIKALHA